MKMDAVEKYMIQLAQQFGHSTGNDETWDCVVISAADVQQKECFQQQIDQMLANEDICRTTTYLVVEDCPGYALGSGGSTFLILKYLLGIFGEKLFHMKILISHAGGNSKRLPSLSCIGKLFCPLPLEMNGKATSILNLKMMITSPFIKLMKNGGLFICASDDIETYHLNNLESLSDQICQLDDDGIIALAHPSSIQIGKTHGVYILPASIQNNPGNRLIPSCYEVVQKPSYEVMKAKGALFKTDNEEERVYTDSMFWCRPALVRKMVGFALECDDLYTTETCIYGDFLTCMGTCPTENKLYWNNLTNSTTAKRKIANQFGSTPLHIMILENSHFYHLGTMPEYLDNLNPSSELFRTLGMKNLVQSQVCCISSSIGGVVTASLLRAEVKQMANSVLDSCVINVPLVCQTSTILSNCLIEDPIVNTIPAGWMFHTAAVKQNRSVLYVTIAFHVDDDLKGSVGRSCGWKLAKFSASSLWQARLFEAHETMSQSFTSTWKSVVSLQSKPILEDLSSTSDNQRFSMEDIVQLKYIPAILEFRRSIFQN